MKYDCTYYWIGGTQRGEWKQADVGLRSEIRKMGYVAHNGNTSIGPPEGPPTKKEIDSCK